VNKRVLLIEDDIPTMELMFHLLSTYGYAPLRASNGEEGLRLAASERPDLILSDIRMPLVDGYEVAERIMADPELNSIPMIAVTEFLMPEHRNKALAAGFDGYITKPISPETFLQHIEAFLHPEFRVPPAPTKVPAIGASPPRPGGRRVLVVDDTPENLRLASSLLASAGYQVTTAGGLGEALRLARDDPPDLIVSDVVMGDGSGFELIRAVKADPRLRAIPFIFNSSSMAVESARKKGLALGAASFLFRPISHKDMLCEVKACLGEPAQH